MESLSLSEKYSTNSSTQLSPNTSFVKYVMSMCIFICISSSSSSRMSFRSIPSFSAKSSSAILRSMAWMIFICWRVRGDDEDFCADWLFSFNAEFTMSSMPSSFMSSLNSSSSFISKGSGFFRYFFPAGVMLMLWLFTAFIFIYPASMAFSSRLCQNSSSRPSPAPKASASLLLQQLHSLLHEL